MLVMLQRNTTENVSKYHRRCPCPRKWWRNQSKASCVQSIFGFNNLHVSCNTYGLLVFCRIWVDAEVLWWPCFNSFGAPWGEAKSSWLIVRAGANHPLIDYPCFKILITNLTCLLFCTTFLYVETQIGHDALCVCMCVYVLTCVCAHTCV